MADAATAYPAEAGPDAAAAKIHFHAKNAAGTLPNLDALCDASAAAAARAAALAQRIRAIDDRRARLAAAVRATKDVLKLRDGARGVAADLAVDDLEAACARVADFRGLEAAAEAGGAALENDLKAMRDATVRVEEVVRARFHEAATARDDAAVARWLPLLKGLGLADEAAADALLDHLRARLRDAVFPPGNDDEAPLEGLRRVVNGVAAVVASALPAARDALGRDGGGRALLLAHDACEAAALAVVARFAAHSRVASHAAEALRDDRWPTESPTPLALDVLDGLLEDCATALRHLETWRRFAAHHAARTLDLPALFEKETRLDAAATELGEWYAVLECRLCRVALKTADDLDTAPAVAAALQEGAAGAPDAPRGSAADDAF